MRKIFLSLTALFLVMFNVSSFADKITITGNPTVLTKQGEIYTLSSDYTPTGDYYFVSVDGVNKVCYAQEQTTLKSLTPSMMKVVVAGKNVDWTCYDYNDAYFTVNP